MPCRAVFFGTPSFAVPSLEALCGVAEVVGVVCQPDRPAGRGLKLSPPAVKVRAMELGIPVVQPVRLREEGFLGWLTSLRADVALVVAYGRILPCEVLEAPRFGCINVHASLLPKFRGAAPIAHALLQGEVETGITLMQLDEGLDTGPLLEQFPLPIRPDENAAELTLRLAQQGASAVQVGLLKLFEGAYLPTPQVHAQATLAPLLRKEEGFLPWHLSATQLHNRVRAFSPWPGGEGYLRGKRVKIHKTQVVQGLAHVAVPGEVLVADKDNLWVSCGEGILALQTIQLEGKKPIPGSAWAIGRGVQKGDRFDASS